MTEFKKKQNGEIYDARNLELRSQQNRAKNLARKFNDLPAEDTFHGPEIRSRWPR